MVLQPNHAERKGENSAFTLIEVLIAFGILAAVIYGFAYGYVQADRMAQWSAMSLAAQSYALQGAEQARAADWRPRDPVPASGSTTGLGTMDEWPAGLTTNQVDFMYVPSSGQPSASDLGSWETNVISVTTVSVNPPVRQIRSDCIWTFALTRAVFTNTVILLRAPDQ
jgi:type II secretory pathway pseudopilin PulG